MAICSISCWRKFMPIWIDIGKILSTGLSSFFSILSAVKFSIIKELTSTTREMSRCQEHNKNHTRKLLQLWTEGWVVPSTYLLLPQCMSTLRVRNCWWQSKDYVVIIMNKLYMANVLFVKEEPHILIRIFLCLCAVWNAKINFAESTWNVLWMITSTFSNGCFKSLAIHVLCLGKEIKLCIHFCWGKLQMEMIFLLKISAPLLKLWLVISVYKQSESISVYKQFNPTIQLSHQTK
jgi:hypothetical protein